MTPKCCVSCKSFSVFRKPSEYHCAPENLMTAKMVNKCPKFESVFDQNRQALFYKKTTEKYKL